MTVRLVGQVVTKEVAEKPVDLLSVGLAAFGHRADIMHVIALVRPIIDVIQLQLPELIPLVKNLLAAVWPGMARDVASNGVILLAIPVTALQEFVGVEADGIYGKATEDAVRRFQSSNNLLPDGWAGRDTLLRMGPGLLKKK